MKKFRGSSEGDSEREKSGFREQKKQHVRERTDGREQAGPGGLAGGVPWGLHLRGIRLGPTVRNQSPLNVHRGKN